MGGCPLWEAVRGRSPSQIGHRTSWAVRVGIGEAGASPFRERRGGVGSPLGSGGEPLAGGAGRLREQATGRRPARGEEPQALPRRRCLGEGGQRRPCVRAGSEAAPSPPLPASSPSKARKTRGQPRRAEATRSTPWVPRAATAGRPHPVRASQSNSPSATTAQPGAGPRRPRPSTGLVTGKGLEAGFCPVGSDGPTGEPADESAGDVGDDDHPGEPLRSPLHEQPGVPDDASRRSRGTPGPAAARRPAHSRDRGGLRRPGRRPARPGTPALLSERRSLSGVEARRHRQQGGVAWRQRGGRSDAAFGLDEWRPWAQARGCRPAARWHRAATAPRPAG